MLGASTDSVGSDLPVSTIATARLVPTVIIGAWRAIITTAAAATAAAATLGGHSAGVGQQAHLASVLDGPCDLALLLRIVARYSTRPDLGSIGHEPLQQVDVLVVDVRHALRLRGLIFFFGFRPLSLGFIRLRPLLFAMTRTAPHPGCRRAGSVGLRLGLGVGQRRTNSRQTDSHLRLQRARCGGHRRWPSEG